MTVPANTLLFRSEGLRVAVIRDGKAVLVPITIGRDYGDKVEVVSGLTAADQVILNPSDSLTSGTSVRLANHKAGGAASAPASHDAEPSPLPASQRRSAPALNLGGTDALGNFKISESAYSHRKPRLLLFNYQTEQILSEHCLETGQD